MDVFHTLIDDIKTKQLIWYEACAENQEENATAQDIKILYQL